MTVQPKNDRSFPSSFVNSIDLKPISAAGENLYSFNKQMTFKPKQTTLCDVWNGV